MEICLKTEGLLTLPPALHSLETDSCRTVTCLAAAVPFSSASISFRRSASLSRCTPSPLNLQVEAGTSPFGIHVLFYHYQPNIRIGSQE